MTDNKPPEKPEQENWRINIGGNVGPGSAVGSNASVQANGHIAGRDITANSEAKGQTPEEFIEILGELRKLIEAAQQEGELEKTVAKVALENVDAAADLATQKPPPRRPIIRKLEDLSELLDGAAETFQAAGGAARVIGRAVPVAALLLKLASYLF